MSAGERAPAGIPRLEYRSERLRATYRFSFAFHAREVRFERDRGQGFENAFPETFSFHADRHDPAELYLRLEDLWSNPRRMAEEAGRRDAEELVQRLLAALPGMLSGLLDRLHGSPALARAAEDVAVLAEIALRFLADKQLEASGRLRMASFHLRQVSMRALCLVTQHRVRPAFLAEYMAGRERAEVSGDATEIGFFYAIASGDAERIDRQVTGAAERAFHRWLEEVCLDEANDAFESEQSPFEDRECEVLRAVQTHEDRPAPAAAHRGSGAHDGVLLERGRDLSPFLRRQKSRDCLRVLDKLERWFLRQYDVHHAAVVRYHAEHLRAGRDDANRRLTRHSTRTYALALALPSLPFVAAVFAYDRAQRFFDVLASLEVASVLGLALWFLVWKFMWKKDLTFFHTSVPRIGAGIIVGYLPVFLIDEVWDLAEQSAFILLATVFVLGSATLLYLYVEVQHRLGDGGLAFARARDIFLLGLIEAAGFGMVVTSFLGPLMAGRNWGPSGGPLDVLRTELTPFAGDLPRVMGLEPLVAFPSAVLLMSFMAFFIGTFLQLLWEDLPMTEPL